MRASEEQAGGGGRDGTGRDTFKTSTHTPRSGGNKLKLPLSMGRKIIEIPLENEGFWRSIGLLHNANSHILSPG